MRTPGLPRSTSRGTQPSAVVASRSITSCSSPAVMSSKSPDALATTEEHARSGAIESQIAADGGQRPAHSVSESTASRPTHGTTVITYRYLRRAGSPTPNRWGQSRLPDRIPPKRTDLCSPPLNSRSCALWRPRPRATRQQLRNALDVVPCGPFQRARARGHRQFLHLGPVIHLSFVGSLGRGVSRPRAGHRTLSIARRPACRERTAVAAGLPGRGCPRAARVSRVVFRGTALRRGSARQRGGRPPAAGADSHRAVASGHLVVQPRVAPDSNRDDPRLDDRVAGAGGLSLYDRGPVPPAGARAGRRRRAADVVVGPARFNTRRYLFRPVHGGCPVPDHHALHR